MSNKRKRSPPFHRDFQEPTEEDRQEALGPFPSTEPRPETLWASLGPNKKQRLEDLDLPYLYQPTSITKRPHPKPQDDQDWLAQVPEQGQTFRDYVTAQTSRSGRLRPLANPAGSTICLLPILQKDDNDSESNMSEMKNQQWPDEAPSLVSLAKVTTAYFDRPVRVLPPAIVTRKSHKGSGSATQKSLFTLDFFLDVSSAGTNSTKRRKIWAADLKGRYNAQTNKTQIDVQSLLKQLARFQQDHAARYQEVCDDDGDADDADNRTNNFCIMGVTLQDLYDGEPNGLFCAGFADVMERVAAFSFHRYHPTLRMCPKHWWDYGYQKTCGNYYSYFDNNGRRPKVLMQEPPEQLSAKGRIEYLRRACKLLLHELGHLYLVDHCIFHNCLMKGTGHLVEDFGAPFHLCGICLRKLQWRLGFDVEERYRQLSIALGESLGHASSEVGWVQRQIQFIAKEKLAPSEDHADS